MNVSLIKASAIAIILLAIGAMVARGQNRLLASAADYQPPLLAEPVVTDPLPAHSQRVVLVVVSGLSDFFWTAETMPGLQQLQEAGARTTIRSAAPTYRLAAWTSLLSGATPPLTDAPLLDVADTAVRQISTDTIFDAAADQSLTTALSGNNRWAALIPPGMVARTAFFGGFAADADAQMMAEVARWLDDPAVSLIVAQFSQIDAAAQSGVESDGYQTALAQVDAELSQLQKMLDLDVTTLIVTADYGHLAQGGHGGDDESVVMLPLALVGQGVVPGEYSPVHQTDIAPTIATLLGTRLPAANQGRPLLEMLAVSAKERAFILQKLAEQRIALATQMAVVADVPYTPPETVSKMGRFFDAENYSGAEQLALLLVSQTDDALDAIRRQPQTRSQRFRFAAGIAGIVLLVGVALWRRTEVWGETIFSAVVAVAGYHGLYRLLKEPYSLSAVDNLLLFRQEVAWLVAASLAAGGIVFWVLVLLRGFSGWQLILQAGYELVLWIAIGFGVTVAWGYGSIGTKISWFFPDATLFFHYLTGLWQTQWAIGIGLFLPFLILSLISGTRKLGTVFRKH